MLVAIGVEQAEQHQRKAEQQSGNHAGEEKACDRHHAASRQRIDHRIVARRNDDRLQRGADGHIGCEHPRIAFRGHLGDHYRTDRGRVGDRRSGDAAHDRGREDIDLRKAAPHPREPDDHGCKVDQPLGHAALGHDGARQHEERDGQHGDLAHATGKLLHDRADRQVDPQRADQRRQRQRIGDRHADRKE